MVAQPEVPFAEDSQRITFPLWPLKVMVAVLPSQIVGVVVKVVPPIGAGITVMVIGVLLTGGHGLLVQLTRNMVVEVIFV